MLHIRGSGFATRESVYLRLFRSFRGSSGFNGVVVGSGARWIGTKGRLKNSYFEFGSGVALSDGTSHDVNSEFNFASFLGGGFYLSSEADAARVGLRWLHISNADLEMPNIGQNQFELVVGWRF
jgi:hypothetical protein